MKNSIIDLTITNFLDSSSGFTAYTRMSFQRDRDKGMVAAINWSIPGAGSQIIIAIKGNDAPDLHWEAILGFAAVELMLGLAALNPTYVFIPCTFLKT